MKDNILIFTDGASRGNPGPGGWGAVIAKSDTKHVTRNTVYEIGGREDDTTNNRMELTAAIEALKASPDGNVVLCTDSTYMVKGITAWIHGWRKNNWQTKAKEDVINRDLWERLAGVVEKRKGNIEWKIIAGHAGIPANERADVIATSFADKKFVELYSGPADRYPVSFEIGDVGNAKKNKKRSPKGTGYSYVSKVDGKIETHATWAECERRVKGKSGARFKKAMSAHEEKEIIQEWSLR